MPKQLPETVDFLKQAERNVRLEGVWPLAGLERLSEVLSDNSGELYARVSFSSGAGYLCMQGSIDAALVLNCQRCLEPMQHEVSERFKFGLITSEEEADELPADIEPYLVEGEEQSLIDVLEDELLLSIPIAAMHQEECSEYLRQLNEKRRVEKEKSNPFAVLKDLKLD